MKVGVTKRKRNGRMSTTSPIHSFVKDNAFRLPPFVLAMMALSVALAAGCATGPQVKRVEATIRIESSPPGAFVMMSGGDQFQEAKAISLGKTPLFRYFSLPETGASLQITMAGYETWNGSISPMSPMVKAELLPLTDESKRAKGWFVSPPFQRITVVPMRLGKKKVGTQTEALETTADSVDFGQRFMAAFNATLKKRLGMDPVISKESALTSDECWRQLIQNMENVCPEKVGFYPTPLQMQVPAEISSALASVGDAVLFVRAEAYYLGSGAQFGRVATALLLTAGSAAAGYSVASAAGSPMFMYTAHGPGPSGDAILVQLFLVHAKTRELLWVGQVVNPQYFKIADNIGDTARKAAEQIPGSFLRTTSGP